MARGGLNGPPLAASRSMGRGYAWALPRAWNGMILSSQSWEGFEPYPNTRTICSSQGSFATSTISLMEIAGGRRFTTSASSTSGAR